VPRACSCCPRILTQEEQLPPINPSSLGCKKNSCDSITVPQPDHSHQDVTTQDPSIESSSPLNSSTSNHPPQLYPLPKAGARGKLISIPTYHCLFEYSGPGIFSGANICPESLGLCVLSSRLKEMDLPC
jgi:hypothetical protein